MGRPLDYISKVEEKFDLAIKKEEVIEFAKGVKNGDVLYSHGIFMHIIKKYPHIVKTEYGYLTWIDVYQFSRGYLSLRVDSYFYEPIPNKKEGLECLTRANRVAL